MCLNEKPALGDFTTTDSQKHNIQAILNLVEASDQVGSAQAQVLTALHLIVSALDGEKAVFIEILLKVFNLRK